MIKINYIVLIYLLAFFVTDCNWLLLVGQQLGGNLINFFTNFGSQSFTEMRVLSTHAVIFATYLVLTSALIYRCFFPSTVPSQKTEDSPFWVTETCKCHKQELLSAHLIAGCICQVSLSVYYQSENYVPEYLTKELPHWVFLAFFKQDGMEKDEEVVIKKRLRLVSIVLTAFKLTAVQYLLGTSTETLSCDSCRPPRMLSGRYSAYQTGRVPGRRMFDYEDPKLKHVVLVYLLGLIANDFNSLLLFGKQLWKNYWMFESGSCDWESVGSVLVLRGIAYAAYVVITLALVLFCVFPKKIKICKFFVFLVISEHLVLATCCQAFATMTYCNQRDVPDMYITILPGITMSVIKQWGLACCTEEYIYGFIIFMPMVLAILNAAILIYAITWVSDAFVCDSCEIGKGCRSPVKPYKCGNCSEKKLKDTPADVELKTMSTCKKHS